MIMNKNIIVYSIVLSALLVSCDNAGTVRNEKQAQRNPRICTEQFDKTREELWALTASIDGIKSYALKRHVWDKLDLNVTFLDGDTVVHRRVMQTARKWEKVCGMRFHFGDHEEADISISFKDTVNDSYIGSESRWHRPSMRLGWLTPESPQEEYDEVVLHEFGHALGMVHEHMVEGVPIIWDSLVVYEYYGGHPNYWSKGLVDSNVFMRYSKKLLNGTKFDSNSIMIYWIDETWTKNDFSVLPKRKISKEDAKLMGSLYKRK